MIDKNVGINNLEQVVLQIGKDAKNAASILANISSDEKNKALNLIADEITANIEEIKSANSLDIKKAEDKKLSKAMIDRLYLDDDRIIAMCNGVRKIAQLDDPVGRILSTVDRPNGLKINKVSVPLGVIGIIYESRPNVTLDAAALCIKSGNAVILRGGSESYNSSNAIVKLIVKALTTIGLPESIVQSIPTTDREAVGYMLRLNDYIDVIIPRGGKGLCKRVQEESRVATLLHLDGNCHSYVHQDADFEQALKIIENAKLRRTGVCCATESIIVDKSISEEFVPKLADMLIGKNCQIRGDEIACQIDSRIIKASEEDWGCEYLDNIVSLKILDNIEQAIKFINKYGSGHTDAILTDNIDAANKFTSQVDSAIVVHNASTQFADGGEFGMGAEIGISTGRLHARGPVGVEGLNSYKYVVNGQGQIRP